MEEEGLSEARKVVMAASLADISIGVCSFSQTCYGHSWVKTCFRRSGAAVDQGQQLKAPSPPSVVRFPQQSHWL